MARVSLPQGWVELGGGPMDLEVESGKVREVVERVSARRPDLGRRLLDERGELRRFPAVLVGERDLRSLCGPKTPLGGDDELFVLPAIEGGWEAVC